jgi:hypothetical protein
MGMLMEVPLDSSIIRAVYRGYTQRQNYREHIQEYNLAMSFVSMGKEIQLLYLEMVHTVSRYMARFTIWPHCCIQMRHMHQDMDNFIFSVLLKQQQNSLKTNQTKSAWLH